MNLSEVILKYGINSPEHKEAMKALYAKYQEFQKELDKSVTRESLRVIEDNRCIEPVYGVKLDDYRIDKLLPGEGFLIFEASNIKVDLNKEEERIKKFALQKKNKKINGAKEHIRRNGKEPEYKIIPLKKERVAMLVEKAKADMKKKEWPLVRIAAFCEILFNEGMFLGSDWASICNAFAKDVFTKKSISNSFKPRQKNARDNHKLTLKKFFK